MGIKITGIDTPFGGVSWEYTETSKNGIQELFYYLETKRILINPVEMEIKSWCVQSAIEMKREIASVLSKYKFNSDTICWLRAMIEYLLVRVNARRRRNEIASSLYSGLHIGWDRHNGSSSRPPHRCHNGTRPPCHRCRQRTPDRRGGVRWWGCRCYRAPGLPGGPHSSRSD